MATRRALGSYALDATEAEKVAALKQALTDCAMELAELSVTFGAVLDALQDAEDAAEAVFYDH